jgi:hypothetical protein
MDINYRALTSQAQAILNKITEDGRQMIYAINPDGSFMEIQPGCTLLSMERYQMEMYIKTTERK